MLNARSIQVSAEIEKNFSRHNQSRSTTRYPCTNGHKDSDIMQDSTMRGRMDNTDKEIRVVGIGDISLPPDRFSVTLKCTTLKENISDAKNSVMKRVDYIMQTLKNYSVKDDDFKMYSQTEHADSLVHFKTELEVHFTDLSRCQEVCNLLTEKLGTSVKISLPKCYHSRGGLDQLRKQVSMLAIYNARQKASEMAKMIHSTVGEATQIDELETSESQENITQEEEDDLNHSILQRVQNATIKMSSKVSVTFQLLSSRSKKT